MLDAIGEMDVDKVRDSRSVTETRMAVVKSIHVNVVGESRKADVTVSHRR